MEQIMTIVEKSLESKESDCNEELKTCPTCGEAVEKVIVVLNKSLKVPLACSCRRAKLEEERIKFENEDKQRRLDIVFKNSLMDKKFKDVTFENWDHTQANEKIYKICSKYSYKFSELKKNNVGLILYGDPGNGKSYASACIANSLLNKGIPVVCVGINALLDRIKETYNKWGSEGEQTVLRSLANAELLILDDLGTEQDTPWSKTQIYNIIDSRSRNELPTIITINLNLNDIEIRYGKRTYDRLLEMCTPVYNDWKSIREEKGKEKTKILKEILD
ncbi:MAG TPA: DNA replication protein [Clostridium sp.]|nr:DNA replication protein [Clostridium sp.]